MQDPALNRQSHATLTGVAVSYPGADEPAVTGLSFAALAGERIGVLGPNAGGKTTLFRLLTGELPTAAGSLQLPCGRVALVPQTDRSRLDYPVSALDVALMGAVSRLPWWKRPGAADRALAREALAQVGLAEHARSTFGDLSGGQRQRVLVARALVQDAPLILLDEPFNGLDSRSAEQLSALIDKLAADGRSLLIATHDQEQTRAWDKVLCVNHRQVAFGPPAETLTMEVIEQTYGSSIVPLDGSGRGLLPAQHCDHEHEHA